MTIRRAVKLDQRIAKESSRSFKAGRHFKQILPQSKLTQLKPKVGYVYCELLFRSLLGISIFSSQVAAEAALGQ